MQNGFYIADWFVDPPSCLIRKGDNPVHLEPRVMDLLVYLARRPEQVHSRDELLSNVWPGTVVSDEALTNAIIKIRKAFNDNARQPEFIETFSKRGYRLIADVRNMTQSDASANESQLDLHASAPVTSISTVSQPARAPRGENRFLTVSALALLVLIAGSLAWVYLERLHTPEPSAAQAGISPPEKPSIAVMPFDNTGGKAEHSYFSDGITDDLITDLQKISGLFVIARNSTFQFKGKSVDPKQVATQLGVRYVLEGSVRRSGNEVRVNTSLIDGASGEQIWANRYDGTLRDVFEVQDRITSQIISALAISLTKADQLQLARSDTPSSEAYDEFLRGWELQWRFTREDFARAEHHFRNALRLDPDYSRARAALALIYWNAWRQKWHEDSGVVSAGWVRARQELNAANSYPTPLAHGLQSAMLLYNRRYQEAISEASKAVELNPNSATGYLAIANALGFSGRPQEAIDHAKIALRLDPNFPAPYLAVIGRVKYDLEQYDDAASILERAVSVNPRDRDPYVVMIAAYGMLGQLEKAELALGQLNRLQQNEKMREFTIDWIKNRWPYLNRVDYDRLVAGLKLAGVPKW